MSNVQTIALFAYLIPAVILYGALMTIYFYEQIYWKGEPMGIVFHLLLIIVAATWPISAPVFLIKHAQGKTNG